MTISALASDVIFRSAEVKTSKNGRAFAILKVRVKDGDSTTWVKAIAFNDHVIAEMQRLADGDHVAVQGRLKLEIFDKDGQSRIGLTIMADHVVALRQPPKARTRKAATAARRSITELLGPSPETVPPPPPDGYGGERELNDDLPF